MDVVGIAVAVAVVLLDDGVGSESGTHERVHRDVVGAFDDGGDEVGVVGLANGRALDRHSLDFLRPRYSEVPENAGAALLIEQVDGDIDYWAEHAPEDSWFAASDQDRERFRRFRHALPELVNDNVRRAGVLKMNTDYAVPRARNREMLSRYRQALDAEFPGRYVIFGHIGDAHVHINLFSDPADPDHAIRVLTDLARAAVALGGTVSAEHGLGKRKAHLLELQYTPGQIAAMRAVKQRLDPSGILGRGTLWSA